MAMSWLMSSRSCIQLLMIGTNLMCAPPGHEILSFLARLREEPESDEGSSPDEGVPMKFAGHRGINSPMMVGVGYVQREFCDGQSLASPGRWPPGSRVYPSSRPGPQ